MITATPFLASAADAKLEDWGPLDEATGEPMHTSGTTLWTGDGDQEAGVWECTAGPSRWSLWSVVAPAKIGRAVRKGRRLRAAASGATTVNPSVPRTHGRHQA
jgi:hypothetical protein